MEYQLPEGLQADYLPKHVAFIMDGNGRWAKKRVMNRVTGHEKGAKSVHRVLEACTKMGIPFLTLYAFSTENWARPKKEVDALMGLLRKFLTNEKASLIKNGVRLTAIGELHRLPDEVREALASTMEATREGRRITLTLALSYGSRAEMVDGVKEIAQRIAKGELSPEAIDEALISESLHTRGTPDPDLVIRTSGEMRLSNFLLWQIAYSEIFFTETLWPDFSEEEFVSILMNYQSRERRFGKVLEP